MINRVVLLLLFLPYLLCGEHLLLLALVREDKLEDILHLVDSGIDVNDAEPITGWTPLIYAAYRGKISLTEFLLLAGADVNLACSDGWTPLMFAARQGHTGTVSTLIAYGADPFITTSNSMTALVAAELSGYSSIVSLIKDYIHHTHQTNMYITDAMGGHRSILPAAHAGNLDVLSVLLQDGHDVNERSSGGWTPLIMGKCRIGVDNNSYLLNTDFHACVCVYLSILTGLCAYSYLLTCPHAYLFYLYLCMMASKNLYNNSYHHVYIQLLPAEAVRQLACSSHLVQI